MAAIDDDKVVAGDGERRRIPQRIERSEAGRTWNALVGRGSRPLRDETRQGPEAAVADIEVLDDCIAAVRQIDGPVPPDGDVRRGFQAAEAPRAFGETSVDARRWSEHQGAAADADFRRVERADRKA